MSEIVSEFLSPGDIGDNPRLANDPKRLFAHPSRTHQNGLQAILLALAGLVWTGRRSRRLRVFEYFRLRYKDWVFYGLGHLGNGWVMLAK